MKKTVLFVNACARRESRTLKLARQLLEKLALPYEEVRLYDIAFPAVDEAYIDMRNRLIEEKAFDSPAFDLARQFAEAETIVIAAPYWDLSFPAVLKQYIEIINVLGITFEYTEEGLPVGLCAARRLYYVATAGGQYVPEEFGFGYVKALAQSFYGIRDVRKIEAAGLDIYGVDVDAIMKSAEDAIAAIDPD